MLSAYMAGMIYTRRAMKESIASMHKAFLKRAVIIYACQAACLVFLFTVIASLGFGLNQPAVTNLLWFYMHEPVTAFWGAMLLIYNPPLLDILPIYIVFMLLSPWVLAFGLRHGWRPILWLSGLLWLATQFGLSRTLYDATVAVTGLTVPFSETGMFETFAWQALWVFGLWLGAHHAKVPSEARRPFPRALVMGAIGIATTFFLWRHITGQSPFAEENPLNALFDKWHMGPMRLLNFFALVVLAMHFAPWLKRHIPRVHWLETLGAASLPVFCAHLVIVLLLLSVVGDSNPARAAWIDAAMYIGSVVVLYIIARGVLSWGNPRISKATSSTKRRRLEPSLNSGVRK